MLAYYKNCFVQNYVTEAEVNPGRLTNKMIFWRSTILLSIALCQLAGEWCR